MRPGVSRDAASSGISVGGMVGLHLQVQEIAEQDGLRLARELTPAAITLDVMMPGLDGWAVLAALKADPELADIPVTMLTIVEDRGLGYALGAADYLTKPIDLDRLLPKIHALLAPAAE